MINKNDAKFIRGIVNDQLERERLFNTTFCNESIIRYTNAKKYCVMFIVNSINDNISELISDIQSIANVSCLCKFTKHGVLICFY